MLENDCKNKVQIILKFFDNPVENEKSKKPATWQSSRVSRNLDPALETSASSKIRSKRIL